MITASMQAITVQCLTEAGTLMLGFVGLLFIGSMVIPWRSAEGARLESGERRTYTLNGLPLFLLVAVLVALGQILGGFSLSMLNTHFVPLFVAANLFAFTLAGALFVLGRRRVGPTPGRGKHLATLLRGLFFGVELNPTLFGLDLKLFSYRPSLIGLALFNASFAVIQYETHGALSTAMILYQVFTFLYVLNYFQFEHGMLFTWDITRERFGWMLIWGDYVLVPFFYSIPGWFLVHKFEPMPVWAIVALIVLFLLGFSLFRGANEQKHRFKLDPRTPIWGRPAETLEGRLLVSGFWGIGRHLNYSGEICMYAAFALTTGFTSPVPYLLPAWLTVLLVHRARRDERRCRERYGELWKHYTARVRFRMVPYLY